MMYIGKKLSSDYWQNQSLFISFFFPILNQVYELHNKYALAELNTEVQAIS